VPLSASLVVEFGGVAHGGAVSVANTDGSDEQLVAVHYGAMMPFSADISSHRCVTAGVCTLRVVACVTPPPSYQHVSQISSHLLLCQRVRPARCCVRYPTSINHKQPRITKLTHLSSLDLWS
jgi:hypothetical protein